MRVKDAPGILCGMPDALAAMLSTLLTVGALSAATRWLWSAGKRLDERSSDEARLHAAVLLLSAKGSELFRLGARTLGRIFDVTFGPKHLSIKCFIRSVLASVITGAAIAQLILIVTAEENESTSIELLGLVMLPAVFNAIPDYLSLMKSRWILKRMSSSSGRTFAAWLCVDTAASAGIGLVAAAVCYLVILRSGAAEFAQSGNFELNELVYRSLVPVDRGGVLFLPIPDLLLVMPIVFYTTFMTTIWGVFYAGAVMCVRLIKPAETVVSRIKWFMRIDEETPFSAIADMLVVLMWCLAVPILLYRHVN
jgi:hypothetical protein